ncbi:MAG: energy-coupling factor ABC transporter permease [Zoogloeaceae bacterium]|jgi:uncharacterized membrane protein|nr:energy-coupling factor ABC transporter permease [Zoogloeaceae bacterium]
MVWTLWRAPWSRFKAEGGRFFNVWLGMIVVLMLLWSMKAGVRPGLDLHLTGIMLLTLAFEPALAFVGLNLVLLALALNGTLPWQSFALNALMTIGVGVVLGTLIHKAVDHFLPRHFFIFVFLKGFFGAALVVIGVGLASALLYGVDGAYAWSYLWDEYLPYYLLLGFAEAWLSGMALTLMLVYRPGWVATFDDGVYLAGK